MPATGAYTFVLLYFILQWTSNGLAYMEFQLKSRGLAPEGMWGILQLATETNFMVIPPIKYL